MPGINFIELNKKEENPWEPLVEKLISPPGTPDMGSIIVTSKTTKDILLETTTDKPLRNLYEGTSTLRFRADIEDNLFHQLSEDQESILSTLPTWELTDDVFYYNIFKNKDKGPIKRKVTFE